MLYAISVFPVSEQVSGGMNKRMSMFDRKIISTSLTNWKVSPVSGVSHFVKTAISKVNYEHLDTF